MPLLSVRRMLAVGTILGPQKERHANWYLESGCPEKLLFQLAPHLDKVGQIIQHYAFSVCNFCSHSELLFLVLMEMGLLVGLISSCYLVSSDFLSRH